jgi:hypothetical protein
MKDELGPEKLSTNRKALNAACLRARKVGLPLLFCFTEEYQNN